jgi:hypothetical protein
MRYFKDLAGQVHGYEETIAFFEPKIAQAIAEGWQEVTGQWPPTETLEATQTRLSNVLTSAINDGAAEWGYDNILSAISYLTSTVPQYAAEAQALNQWRDQIWIWATPALASVTPGETAGQFLANMPALPTRPTTQ